MFANLIANGARSFASVLAGSWNQPHPMQLPSGQLCLPNFIISNINSQLAVYSLIIVPLYSIKFYILFVL